MKASIPGQTLRRGADLADAALQSPILFLSLQIVAFWHVWRWMAARAAASGEPVWEVVPLVAVLLFSWFSKPKQEPGGIPLIPAALFLVAYAASFAVAPPMIRAVLAMASITFVLSRWRFDRVFHSGIFVLLLLALPLTESLNFFLGYPMRAVVGEAVASLLNLQGLDVFREGVSLHFGEKLIWIDAPCSGVKMLWFGTLLAASLSCYVDLGSIRLAAVLALTFAAIMLGNILRASGLFYIEGGLVDAPDWMHSAVGVVAFLLTSLMIVCIVRTLAGSKWRK